MEDESLYPPCWCLTGRPHGEQARCPKAAHCGTPPAQWLMPAMIRWTTTVTVARARPRARQRRPRSGLRLRGGLLSPPDWSHGRHRLVGQEVEDERVHQVRLLLGEEVRRPGDDGELR